MSFERLGTPSGEQSYVVAYQKEGTAALDSYPIPRGKEKAMDQYLSNMSADGAKFKSGLVLKKDEIKGIFTRPEFEQFKRAFFAPEVIVGPGKQSFLELGKALKEKQSLEKWKSANSKTKRS